MERPYGMEWRDLCRNEKMDRRMKMPFSRAVWMYDRWNVWMDGWGVTLTDVSEVKKVC